MKKALVLAGGGTKGAYQNGAIRALRELGESNWDLVTGTSIGALNGALVVQHDYEAMDQLWKNLVQEDIIKGAFQLTYDLNTLVNERNLFAPFFKNYIKERGADVSPFRAKIEAMFQEDRFFASTIDYSCICVDHKRQKPVFVTKEMMKGDGAFWLLASSSAFPAFPVAKKDEEEYVDGGYYDNCPIDLALQLGADEIIAIDLNHHPHHPLYLNQSNIRYIFPQAPTGPFLNFVREDLDRLDACGYLDVMKQYGRYKGVRYTFEKEPLPYYVTGYLRDLLLLETKIKLATNVNERFRSESMIHDTLRSRQEVPITKDWQKFYGLMDVLMEMASCEVSEIYTYQKARDQILASFSKAAYENFSYSPIRSTKDMVAFASTLDKKGVVEKIVHTALYPDHAIFSENMILTLYPFEKALADLVLCMMKEIGEEYL